MARASDASRVLTLPNIVSTSRVALAIGFVAVDAVPVRLALIGAASITDFLDGWIARRTQAASRIGALIDPIADRLFVLGVVLSYVIGGELAIWQAVAIMFRDVMSVIGWFVARRVSWLRPITFRARIVGKLVTVFQLATFIAVLLAPRWVDALVIVVAVLGVVATVDYTLMLWRERVRTDRTDEAG
ncbi:MAG TPA: CDP-alcohol phosphatidyltransferase family protein [Gemmatimonas aurantiaca]|uniref:CDP-diacylglycerol--glycerol-3-phosphate 3-phosphatidyltransferase n=2 Tax=Gemmatimonas aurantiaca TaxID=173480 RepID=C1AA49_GEMAT|nr:CDP-alcohol phosphatidyltransferase family protein [Gemmatimonas aurantiaca]BAH39647.1 CDP-alcohol phosphatidyltransferase family protein [Gemmatimonas aurantiaca T-27]HCT58344.1 CDP-alcohol phosphatidyltransferase family protein [Gemmatimonas aurantiaca]